MANDVRYAVIIVVIILVMLGLIEPIQSTHKRQTLRIPDHVPGNINTAIQALRGDLPLEHTGAHLLLKPVEALRARLTLIRNAQYTVDIQYYIYKDDLTGRLLMNELLKAADRGVRVRILLDDFGSFNTDRLLSEVEQHNNIEVRLYNAFSRARSLFTQLVFGFRNTTRRMHNKTMIIDNQLSIIGGRNIGNEYFGLDPNIVFKDIDVILTNPTANKISGIFDQFWNHSRSSKFKNVFKRPSKAQHRSQNSNTRNVTHDSEQASIHRNLLEGSTIGGLDIKDLPFRWSKVDVQADPASKTKQPRNQSRGMWFHELKPNLDLLRERLIVVTPYFVPTAKGVAFFQKLRQKGIRIVVITNSLESTDVPIVHSGYARYRPQLLDMGVELYEVDGREKTAHSKNNVSSWFASRSSLHAKLFIFDDRETFIGSPNFDPRSFYENTEVGVTLDSEEITRELADKALNLVISDAFRVEQTHDNKLKWTKNSEVFFSEPGASTVKRALSYLSSFLPIENQL